MSAPNSLCVAASPFPWVVLPSSSRSVDSGSSGGLAGRWSLGGGLSALVTMGLFEAPAEADCGAWVVLIAGDVHLVGKLAHEQQSPPAVARCAGSAPSAVVGDCDHDVIVRALGGEQDVAPSLLVGVLYRVGQCFVGGQYEIARCRA
jgi:hypothetical protein